MSVLSSVLEPEIAVAFTLALAVLTGLCVERLKMKLMAWVRKQVWLERMIPLQRALMMNFGYPESDCTFEACLDSYCFVICICGHHFLMSFGLAPVVLLGWEGAGQAGQLAFVLCAFGDLAYSVYDSVQVFLRTFFPDNFKSLGVKMPVKWFCIIVGLHHSLAMGLTLPMVLNYPSLRAFHFLMISLLLAAGICFLLGCYKFTLDTKSYNDFLQYKGIVLVQFTTIWITRCFVWFSQAYAALKAFQAAGDTAFLIGGIMGGGVMSLFNLIVLADATDAAVKWLPKPMPKSKEEHRKLRRALSDENMEPVSPRAVKMVDMDAKLQKKIQRGVQAAVGAARF